VWPSAAGVGHQELSRRGRAGESQSGHDFRPHRYFTPRAAAATVAGVAKRGSSLSSAHALLTVVAGGSGGTGRLVASLARAQGRVVRVVDDPERAPRLPAAMVGADCVVLVPARGTASVAAQARAVIDSCASAGPDAPHFVLVTGFSVGHGRAHALNTPKRLADLVAAEELVGPVAARTRSCARRGSPATPRADTRSRSPRTHSPTAWSPARTWPGSVWRRPTSRMRVGRRSR